MRAQVDRWRLLRATVGAWLEDDAPRMAAALAYSAIVSMAPLFLVILDVTEFVLGKQAASGERQHSLEILGGPGPAKAIEDVLGTINPPGGIGLVSGVNFAIFLLGSIWVFFAFQDSLNTIWKVPSRAGVSWFLRMRGRLLLFALVLGTGGLLLTMLAASVTLTNAVRSLESPVLSAGVLRGSNVVLSFVLFTFLFALIYKFLPEAHVQWRHAWAGALASSLLHSIGNFAIGLYLAHSTLTSVYGAASSVIVIMVWVYYTSLGFLLGAEFTHQLGLECKTPAAGSEQQVGGSNVQACDAPGPVAQPNAAKASVPDAKKPEGSMERSANSA